MVDNTKSIEVNIYDYDNDVDYDIYIHPHDGSYTYVVYIYGGGKGIRAGDRMVEGTIYSLNPIPTLDIIQRVLTSIQDS